MCTFLGTTRETSLLCSMPDHGVVAQNPVLSLSRHASINLVRDLDSRALGVTNFGRLEMLAGLSIAV